MKKLLVIMNENRHLVDAISASAPNLKIQAVKWDKALRELCANKYDLILLISYEKNKADCYKKDHESYLRDFLPVDAECFFTDELSLSLDYERIFNFLES